MNFRIQSEKHDADKLEYSINMCLLGLRSWDGFANPKLLEAVKMALIGEMSKPDKNLGAEAWNNWSSIVNEQYTFDSKDREIETIRKMTIDEVQELYRKLIFEEPRRLNVKIHS